MPKLPKSRSRPWIASPARTTTTDKSIEDSQKFYNSRAWRNYRLEIIANNPVCIECKKINKYIAAKVIDHVIPIRQGGSKYDIRNLQPLCNVCHNKKRSLESRGIISPYIYNDQNEKIPDERINGKSG